MDATWKNYFILGRFSRLGEAMFVVSRCSTCSAKSAAPSTWFGTRWKFTDSVSLTFNNPRQSPLWSVPILGPKESSALVAPNSVLEVACK